MYLQFSDFRNHRQLHELRQLVKSKTLEISINFLALLVSANIEPSQILQR